VDERFYLLDGLRFRKIVNIGLAGQAAQIRLLRE